MEVRSNCPRPHSNGPDTGKHLYYNTDSRLWYCFVCGYSGRGENPGDEPTVPHNTYPEISLSERAQALFDILNRGSKTESLIVRAALRYLSTHHVDPLYASFVWGILIDGQDIVFPVFRDNKMIYFQKRNLFNKRFFNPPV